MRFRVNNALLGVTSHQRNEKCVKDSHEEDACYDCRKSKDRRFGFHQSEAAQKGWDRREDPCPVRCYAFPARLTGDHSPGPEC
jgi:hypothetical protein